MTVEHFSKFHAVATVGRDADGFGEMIYPKYAFHRKNVPDLTIFTGDGRKQWPKRYQEMEHKLKLDFIMLDSMSITKTAGLSFWLSLLSLCPNSK